MVTGSLQPDYFDRMYSANADPWDFSGRWYEERKRAVTMASLPRRHFRHGFEPGCSIGLLTELLAARCDRLLATDVSAVALEAATVRLSGCPSVRIESGQMPRDWPAGEFDLIVLSEIAYYCSELEAAELGRRVAAALSHDGALVLCHWLHKVEDYPLEGQVAQQIVRDASGLVPMVRHREPDFLLEVMTRPGTPSVAAREGLVE